jgi:hypothetical protein
MRLIAGDAVDHAASLPCWGSLDEAAALRAEGGNMTKPASQSLMVQRTVVTGFLAPGRASSR